MSKHIKHYLDKKKKDIENKYLQPIITSWVHSSTMESSLEIIDKHVEVLLNKQGGMRKLDQWFLSGDEGFTTITAERYIIKYLQSKNINIIDNLDKEGIDAYFTDKKSSIGIEITTLNKDVFEWIFTERLIQFIKATDALVNRSFKISYSQERVLNEFNGKRIQQYLENIYQVLSNNDIEELSKLDISLKYHPEVNLGYSFQTHNNINFDWYDTLTNELYSNLDEKNKKKQLKKLSKNLVFVGLNNSAPSDGIFPRIFRYVKENSGSLPNEIQKIKKYWDLHISSLTNVIGICYFFYSLDQETPFYPLEIFWRNEEDKFSVNL